MPRRLLSCLIVLTLVCQVQAQGRQRRIQSQGGKPPTVVVRLKSLDDLIEDAKYLAKLAGQEDRASELTGFLDALREDNKGIRGIDTKRPIGLYGKISPDVVGSSGIILIPVADEKSLLEALDQFNVKVTKEKEDPNIYDVSHEMLPIPLFLRFEHKYAYITAQNKEGLKGRLMEPEAMFAAPGRTGTLTAAFHLSQIPEPIKQIVLGGMELQLSEQQEKEIPGETPAQKEIRVQAIKAIGQQLGTLIKEGGALELMLDVDRKANQLVAEIDFAGVKGSSLAGAISGLGKSESLFGGIIHPGAAINFVAHGALPEDIRKAIAPAIDEALKSLMEKDQTEHRDIHAKLIHAIEPTLKSGDLDVAFSLRGPSTEKHYGVVFGIKVKDGKAIESALEQAVQAIPEGERDMIKLNAETVDGVAIHRIDAQKHFDEHAQQVLGNHPVFVAVRSDAIFVAAGNGGKEALKAAIAGGAKVLPAIALDLSLAKLAPLMAQGGPAVLDALHKEAEAAFHNTKGTDRTRLTIEGGDSFKIRFSMSAADFQFLSRAYQNPEIQKLTKPPQE